MTGPSVSRCCAYGKHLARPHREPAVGELDLPHRHRAGIGESQEQRVAVRRIAGDADGVGQQVVGHRRHRALEHFGEPVVRVQLVPDGCPAPRGARARARARAACRRTSRAAGSWASRPCSSGSPSSSGLRHIEYCSHRPCHSAIAWSAASSSRSTAGWPFARVAARELRVQMGDELAQHLGDRRALARRKAPRPSPSTGRAPFRRRGRRSASGSACRPPLRCFRRRRMRGCAIAVGPRRRIRARSAGR